MGGSPRKRARKLEAAASAGTLDKPVAWQPNPGPQRAFLTCPCADIFYGGERGGGKTAGIIGDWLRHSAAHGYKARGLLIRLTYHQLVAEVHMSHIVPLFSRLGARFRASEGVWTMPNSSTLRLGYLESVQHAEQYQGGEYTWIGVDELGNFPSPEPVDRLRATMRSTAGVPCEMRATGNPGGPGQDWIRERYVRPALPGVPFVDATSGIQRIFIRSRLADTPQLAGDDGYVTRLKSSGPAWLVRAWLEGDWNASLEGGLILLSWLRRYRCVPDEGRVFVSIDTAMKAGELNDFTVAIAAKESGRNLYVLDVMRAKIEHPERKRRIRQFAARWSPEVVIIEDKGSGTDLLQEFRDDREFPWSLAPMTPTMDKIIRMSTESPFIEEGRLFLPEAAPWSLDFEGELMTFPNAVHDDQVDALSQLLRYLRERVRGKQFAMDMATW